MTTGQVSAPGTGTMDSGSGVVQTDYATVRASLADYAIANGIDDRLEISRSSEGIVIRIGGSLLFESGRAILDSRSTELLGRIVALVKPLPNRIRIEGHTDDVAPDGYLFRDNWQLSVGRAKAVLDAMVGVGIQPAPPVGRGPGPVPATRRQHQRREPGAQPPRRPRDPLPRPHHAGRPGRPDRPALGAHRR